MANEYAGIDTRLEILSIIGQVVTGPVVAGQVVAGQVVAGQVVAGRRSALLTLPGSDRRIASR
jgi:hypothetical protein